MEPERGARSMRISIPALITSGIVVAGLAIIGLSALDRQEATQLSAINVRLVHDQRIISSLESIRFHAQVLQIGYSAFLASNQENFLEHFRKGEVILRSELKYLESRREDNLILQRRFEELNAIAEALISGGERTALPSNAKVLQNINAARDAKNAHERLQQIVYEMLAEERKVFDRLEEEQIAIIEQLRVRVLVLSSVSFALLLAFYAVIMIMLRRQRRDRARIQHEAHFDQLTGLPNRSLLMDRLKQQIALSMRQKQTFAVLMMDLDEFKQVNDSLGHAAGDALLAEVARRAQSVVRGSDTAGRLGGDEFLAILPGVDIKGATEVAGKLVRLLAGEYQLGNKTARVTSSIGIAIYPYHGTDADLLIRNADLAMYAAKKGGKNAYRSYGPELQGALQAANA